MRKTEHGASSETSFLTLNPRINPSKVHSQFNFQVNIPTLLGKRLTVFKRVPWHDMIISPPPPHIQQSLLINFFNEKHFLEKNPAIHEGGRNYGKWGFTWICEYLKVLIYIYNFAGLFLRISVHTPTPSSYIIPCMLTIVAKRCTL